MVGGMILKGFGRGEGRVLAAWRFAVEMVDVVSFVLKPRCFVVKPNRGSCACPQPTCECRRFLYSLESLKNLHGYNAAWEAWKEEKRLDSVLVGR